MASVSRWRLGRFEAISDKGVVAAKTPLAAEFGAKVLEEGGNAVDAAVVTAAVAAVVEPWMNGFGGGGFLVRHDSKSGESSVVSFPMVAPKSATPEMFPLSGGTPDTDLFGWPSVVGGANVLGAKSVCVPGTPAGLALALQKYGTYSYFEALGPAIDLARHGFPVTWHTSMEIARDLANLRKFEATEALLCPNGIVPWSASQDNPTLLRQPDLADILEILAKDGARAYYEGAIAQKIVTYLNGLGADFSLEDFSSYQAVIEDALVGSYNGHGIVTTNYGTGGPTLVESLGLLDGFDLSHVAHNSVEALHLCAQAFAIAFADRFAYLADPDFVQVPIDALLSDAYLDARCEEMMQDRIGNLRPGTPDQLGVTHGLPGSMPDYSSGGSTTHLSVIDKDGVAVSLTQTLLSLWGSRVTVPETGLIMNNGMMWFDPEPGRPNSVAGGKKPLANMSPAIITKNGEAVAAIGASGGRRIQNCQAQIAMNLIDHGMSMQEAVTSPRIDRSTRSLYVSSRMPKAVVSGLAALEHRVSVRDETLFFGDFASPACVQRTENGELRGGVDPFYFPATAQGI
ncbi:MAG: gamma-glutamyltransferase [Thermomicrobiales bacterium]|nr:gamma-glutamyltransferase [Thermomicrobiales bacterium]MCO5223329.1 gamma-glutamyltransferase [Thermomicrobiales bacterium]